MASSHPKPREWPAILRLAFTANPIEASYALVDLLNRRQVRGWNRLSLAASRHRNYYASWIAVAERSLLSQGTSSARLSIGAVILGDRNRHATITSLRTAFGGGLEIFDESRPLPAVLPKWLLPIRGGDLVSPALAAMLAAWTDDRDISLLYWDEDEIERGLRVAPWIKPDWDPLLFGVHDGLIGSCLIRAKCFPAEPITDWPAFAYELAAANSTTRHVQAILTHRGNARTASMPGLPQTKPISISVIIPTRDRCELLRTCLDGLFRTQFPGKHEIIIVDNDSQEPETFALFERLEATGRVRIIREHGSFNFAGLANAGVAAASSDFICLLNNDIEVVSPEWLIQMSSFVERPDVGAVGARLLYPDGRIQHAGVAIGIGGAAGHVEKNIVPRPGSFAPWHGENRSVSAVTGACLLVARNKYLAVGGMDAEHFAIDFNDVDLCLRLGGRGWRTVYCASATLIHHESKSRGAAKRGEQLAQFERELASLRDRWHTLSVLDPYHSPLFRRQSERCLLNF